MAEFSRLTPNGELAMHMSIKKEKLSMIFFKSSDLIVFTDENKKVNILIQAKILDTAIDNAKKMQ